MISSLATDFLRETTLPLHHELDQIALMKALMDSDLNASTYIRVLQGMSQCFVPIEAAIQNQNSLHFYEQWQYLPKSPSLAQDLKHFGKSFPQPSSSFFLKNEGEALGALYVLFGSTLGARFISKHVAQKLPVMPGAGLDFYGAHGDEMGRWLKFKEKLNFKFEDRNFEDLKSGALQTFTFFIETLKNNSITI